MPKAMCVQCDQEFSSVPELANHEKSGHQLAGAPLNTNPMPLVTPEMLAVVEREKERKKQLEQQPVVPAAPTAPTASVELPKPTPIKLTYAYTGNCPACNTPVKTLELDVKDTHVVVAFCPKCDTQCESREVAKLTK